MKGKLNNVNIILTNIKYFIHLIPILTRIPITITTVSDITLINNSESSDRISGESKRLTNPKSADKKIRFDDLILRLVVFVSITKFDSFQNVYL